jgi:ketosteroid isomerase-like protein
MSEVESERLAIRFVNEINRHDVAALAAMMAPDFRFIDSLGHEVRGRDRMCQAWTSYFQQFPDYHIVIREHLAQGQIVALFGNASGTVSGSGTPPVPNRWTLPAAWRAVIWEGQVTEWQVYADNEPVSKLLNPSHK